MPILYCCERCGVSHTSPGHGLIPASPPRSLSFLPSTEPQYITTLPRLRATTTSTPESWPENQTMNLVNRPGGSRLGSLAWGFGLLGVLVQKQPALLCSTLLRLPRNSQALLRTRQGHLGLWPKPRNFSTHYPPAILVSPCSRSSRSNADMC